MQPQKNYVCQVIYHQSVITINSKVKKDIYVQCFSIRILQKINEQLLFQNREKQYTSTKMYGTTDQMKTGTTTLPLIKILCVECTDQAEEGSYFPGHIAE